MADEAKPTGTAEVVEPPQVTQRQQRQAAALLNVSNMILEPQGISVVASIVCSAPNPAGQMYMALVINPFVPADGISDLLLKVETLARELRESMDRANARIHGLHRGPSIVE